jgi:hypothetical protein
MDKIIITAPHETRASLAELARQINAEHEQVDVAVREGLDHARQAGFLLLQAKSRLPHGNWLPWLEANCKATARTVQRYMRLAEHWEDVVASGGSGLALRDALRLLTHRKEELANTTHVSHLPPPLAYYVENGGLNQDALRQLLNLVDDYGPEIPSGLRFSKAPEEPIKTEDAWWLLNTIRPLDHPTLWPFKPDIDKPGTRAVAAAANLFIKDGRARGDVPAWEVAAFWFSSTMVHFADASADIAERFASILHHHLEVWRESFRTALAAIARLGRDHFKDFPDGHAQWWGYYSDLRHACALNAALELTMDPASHPSLHRSSSAGLLDIARQGSRALPSSMQGWLDGLTSEATPAESPPPVTTADDHGDAWEPPEDRLPP